MSLVKGVVAVGHDGVQKLLYPFHSCLKGIETKILFRDEEDYGVYVKMIFVCARRVGVTVIIYGVVSNHSHECILSDSLERAILFGERLKMMYSKYFHNKYGEEGALKRVKVTTLLIDSDWYLRNVLAYIPRNALDNGALNVSSYKWTGYHALFCNGTVTGKATRVKDLDKRSRIAIMHTEDILDDVPWLLDESNDIIPASCCNWKYAEAAFNHDQAFFLKVLGQVNSSEMNEKLVDAPRVMKNDNEFMKTARDACQRWFSTDPGVLPLDKKARIIPYLYRNCRTTVSQLARTFEIERAIIERIISGK